MEIVDNEAGQLIKNLISPTSSIKNKNNPIDMNSNSEIQSDKLKVVLGPAAPPSSEKVKVIVRCRPISQKEIIQGHTSVVAVHKERNEIEVHRPNPSSSNLANTKIDKVFTFDSVYDDRTSQSELYKDAFSGIVDSVLNGFNGTIFAYGQTGTGKTFTMEGIRDKEEYHGVIPNAFKHIFDKINNSPNRKYLVRASYLEIYQEEIRDLLFKDKLRTCELKESPDNGVYVKDLSTYLCGDYKDINELMSKGNKNRSVGATNMNEHSSRSHAIFMITIEMSEEWADGRVHFKVGKLNLVDLAGSERQGKTGSEGERLKEAVKINLSLSTLGHVIGALADGKSSHIPYRDSKLTRLLQDSLGGNSKTIMVATIGPASFNYDETMVTLRYASRAKRIKNKPKINEDPKDAMLRVYQEEISRLKAQLEAKKNQQQKAVLNSFKQDHSGRPKTGQRSRPVTAGSDQAYLDQSLMKELAPYIEAHRLQENLDPKEILKILEEKRKALLMDNETVKEEKERLIKKLELTQKRVRNAEEECSKLHTKIEWLESKVLNGGKSLLDHTNEQQKLIEQRKREIEEEKSKEEEIRQRILEHEMGVVELRDLKTSLEAQIEYKCSKSNKIISKVQKVHNRRVERIQMHDNSCQEIRSHLTSLQRESHMSRVIIENFIPSKMKMLCEKLCQYHDSDTSYTLLPITSVTFSRPPVNRALRVPLYTKSLDGHYVPLDLTYFSDENILQLHPLISGPTSKNYVPPDTDPYIKSLSQKAQSDSEKEVVIDCTKLKTRISTARVRLSDVITLDNGQRVRQVLTARHRSREIPYQDYAVVNSSNSKQLSSRPKTAVSFPNSNNNKRTGGQAQDLLSPLKHYFKDNDPYLNLLRKLPRSSTAVPRRNEQYDLRFPGLKNNGKTVDDNNNEDEDDDDEDFHTYWGGISSINFEAKRSSLSRSNTFYNKKSY